MIAVTGWGVVSACGVGVEAFGRGLFRGTTAVGLPARFDTSRQRTRLAAEAPEIAETSQEKRLARADRLAIAAAAEAWASAGLGPDDRELAGLYVGGSTAAMAEGEVFFQQLTGRRPGRARARDLVSHPLDGPGNAVARSLGLEGPVVGFSSACASGALALGAALEALRDQTVEVAVAGGADALCQLTYAGFNALRAVDEQACRPFRVERAGLSLGEGAAFVILERLERAQARGRAPLGFLLGAGASCDAHHMTAPHPEGLGAARAIRAALADAELGADAVDWVNAHGTGTPLNDVAEAKALQEVFGARAASLPVTSTKSIVGHLLGSSGAIEAVATLLCLREQKIHPTAGSGTAESGVDLVSGAPRQHSGRVALSTSLAFGGSNGALILAAESWRG